jgi:hypothetical protein
VGQDMNREDMGETQETTAADENMEKGDTAGEGSMSEGEGGLGTSPEGGAASPEPGDMGGMRRDEEQLP